MKSQLPIVELLVNPFCMAHRDVDSVRKVCAKHGVEIRIYNLWEIDDEDLNDLPVHIGSLIQEWRLGQ